MSTFNNNHENDSKTLETSDQNIISFNEIFWKLAENICLEKKV